ncbi:hypothetical protein SASPL_144784 [Salvia splendens]|uniref:Uncharacterized protein n=1 Tax=Salvia splendens TaxID=180675 RepID=A0A8X8WH71_SALSN|nr:hypothetical protein SASPL_144784 [Salvia splendens]
MDSSSYSESTSTNGEGVGPVIPICKAELRPYEGQKFSSLEEGISFYEKYAQEACFDFRRFGNRSSGGVITFQYVVCNRQGFHTVDPLDVDVIISDDVNVSDDDEFVAHFDTLWRAAQEFGVTELDGIEKLIELLPDSWKEWAERTARRYTWHEPVTDDMVGDMAGFRKAVYCALVDSREEQPPQDVQEGIVYQDKYVSMYEDEQGFEDDYEEEPEEAPQGNSEEDDDEDPEEGPMDEDDRVVV